MGERERTDSLKGVFKRDFEGQMPVFFDTTEMVNKATRERVFEIDRSMRLHWMRFHLNQSKAEHMLLFSVKEPEGIRTYYYDVDEKYVIVLEPLRSGDAYYLLSAYYIKGKDAQRNKIEKKYKRKLERLH